MKIRENRKQTGNFVDNKEQNALVQRFLTLAHIESKLDGASMRVQSKYGRVIPSKKEEDRARHVSSVQELSSLYDDRNN